MSGAPASPAGKVAIVTGSSKGIGLAIAEALVRTGANVTVSARHVEEVRLATARLNRLGAGRALGVPCDVRRPAEVEQLIERSVAEFGGLDILVNNAGVGAFAPAAGSARGRGRGREILISGPPRRAGATPERASSAGVAGRLRRR